MPALDKFKSFLEEGIGNLKETAESTVRKGKELAGDMSGLGDLSDKATKTSVSSYGVNGAWKGKTDAMRHIMFSALLTQKAGEIPAKTLSYLNEMTSFGTPDDIDMDLTNDKIGREIGSKAKDFDEIIRMSREAIDSGKAKVLIYDSVEEELAAKNLGENAELDQMLEQIHNQQKSMVQLKK